jgi:hypothetical protein
MQQPKIDVQPQTLSQLLNAMELGKLQVPRFQRDFVWPLTKTRRLLDSMYKEFPIGTFFLWRAPAGSPLLSRPLTELGIPKPNEGAEVSYILDGQQRLTSLFAVIKGLKLGSRDYGRVSIDLKTATIYDNNRAEGFEEDIFVYRTGDNHRYVSVQDLVGPNHLDIYDEIPKEWKGAFNRAHNTLQQTYPLSVVWIQEQDLSDAIEIFQRINQAGKPLSRYDLVCANVWSEDFDFRKRVASLNRQFAQQGFGELHDTIYTQTFALVLKDRCTTAAELSLDTGEIMSNFDRVVRAIRLAVDFAANNLGVKRAEFFPYRGIVPVLAYYFYHSPRTALSAKEREALWQWFWRVTLSERYSTTSPSRMAEDALKLRDLLEGKEVKFTYPANVTSEAVMRSRMTRASSALRNAVICMLALKQPRNLKDGSPVNLQDVFFSDLKKTERHHIFPVGYLKETGMASGRVHMVPNFCFIPADLNREIGSRPPADYLAQYKDENPDFDAAAASHLLPAGDGAAVWRNDFRGFIEERAELIAEELRKLVDITPAEYSQTQETISKRLLADKVDLLEIRIRDFIDHRLRAVMGDHYWKEAMPGDVISDTKQVIASHISRHPYEDWSQYPPGRKRLDFCDVSHYEKIILKNWTQFEGFFDRKDQFQAHMEAYRTLRNSVHHNREPSEIDRKRGEAAMMWLERIMDRYDGETSRDGESDEDEM